MRRIESRNNNRMNEDEKYGGLAKGHSTNQGELSDLRRQGLTWQLGQNYQTSEIARDRWFEGAQCRMGLNSMQSLCVFHNAAAIFRTLNHDEHLDPLLTTLRLFQNRSCIVAFDSRELAQQAQHFAKRDDNTEG
ncbi:unnamed protein product [Sphagnum balticum]